MIYQISSFAHQNPSDNFSSPTSWFTMQSPIGSRVKIHLAVILSLYLIAANNKCLNNSRIHMLKHAHRHKPWDLASIGGFRLGIFHSPIELHQAHDPRWPKQLCWRFQLLYSGYRWLFHTRWRAQHWYHWRIEHPRSCRFYFETRQFRQLSCWWLGRRSQFLLRLFFQFCLWPTGTLWSV